MYYYRQPPKRGAKEYFMPFLVLLFLVVVIIFGWRTLNTLLLEDNRETSNERVFLNIEEGSVKAMPADNSKWDNVPDQIYLYRGEKVKTGADGRATLTFPDESLVRLNHESEIHFLTLRRKSEVNTIEIALAEGNAWAEINDLKEPDSSFILDTDRLQVSTRGGTLALTAPDTVYMMEGSAQIGVKNEKEVIKTYTLGVGQQFMIDVDGIQKLMNDQDLEVIFAVSDSFRNSDWYQWNLEKGGVGVAATEESETEEARSGSEEESEATEELAAESSGTSAADPNDKTPPPVPTLTEPASAGTPITLTDITAVISGKVSVDTDQVIVNDYALQRYQPGTEEFRYVAHVNYDNLKVGENEYKIVAKDRSGNVSQPVTITLVLPQEVYDAKSASADSEEPASTPEEMTSGGVKITEPNGGEDFTTSETKFDIKGVVPVGTAKVMVNDYALSRFEAGKTTWTYKAYKSLGSLTIGQKNTYTVKAYDAEGGLLGQDSLTIDVESEGAPQITIPTSRTSYLTNLNELVVGGTVGKWVQVIYVNDNKLLNYIPGSEKWHNTVILQPGKNVFRVTGESNGVKTASDEIEITYQP